jgi:hypothetical protein
MDSWSASPASERSGESSLSAVTPYSGLGPRGHAMPPTVGRINSMDACAEECVFHRSIEVINSILFVEDQPCPWRYPTELGR